jgi:hypothetical protein
LKLHDLLYQILELLKYKLSGCPKKPKMNVDKKTGSPPPAGSKKTVLQISIC